MLYGKSTYGEFFASEEGMAAYEKYKDKNFTVLGVSLDQASTKEAWLADHCRSL